MFVILNGWPRGKACKRGRHQDLIHGAAYSVGMCVYTEVAPCVGSVVSRLHFNGDYLSIQIDVSTLSDHTRVF